MLVAIWRIAILMGLRSPGWVLAGSLLTLLTGAYLLLRTRLSRPWAIAGAAACMVFPPVLAWDVQVGVDAWFAALAIFGFGCLARATSVVGRGRVVYLALAVAAAFLVACTRLTAVPVSFLILMGVCLTAVGGRRLPRWRLGLLGTVGAVVSTGVVAALITGLDSGVLHTGQASPAQGTYIYDLAAMSRAEAVVLFPADVYPAQTLLPLRQRSSTTTADPIEFSTTPLIVGFPLQGARYASLQHAWLQAIERHPGAYLHARLRFALHLLAIDAPAFYPHEVGPPPPGDAWALANPSAHDAAMSYVSEFTDTVQLELPWAYAILLTVSLAWFGRRRSAADRVNALLALALLVYLGVMVFALPSAVYRYIYPIVAGGTVLTLIVAVEVAATLVTRRRPRLSATTPQTMTADAFSVRPPLQQD